MWFSSGVGNTIRGDRHDGNCHEKCTAVEHSPPDGDGRGRGLGVEARDPEGSARGVVAKVHGAFHVQRAGPCASGRLGHGRRLPARPPNRVLHTSRSQSTQNTSEGKSMRKAEQPNDLTLNEWAPSSGLDGRFHRNTRVGRQLTLGTDSTIDDHASDRTTCTSDSVLSC